jgi:hypothetical protein
VTGIMSAVYPESANGAACRQHRSFLLVPDLRPIARYNRAPDI